MIFERLFDVPVVSALKKGLEGAAVRHHAIANNIANVSTPGYKRQVVKFEEELWSALGGASGSLGLRTTRAKHCNGSSRRISEIRPAVEVDKKTTIRVDRNTVNIDQEMVDLAKTSGQFAQQAELLNRFYGQIKMAIRGEVR